jgi:putative transcriptional regulator
MAIMVTLDIMLARRKMRLNDLADAVGVSIQNLSILKTGKARAVRFSTLSALCKALQCQPGDIMVYVEGEEGEDEGEEIS